MTRWFVAIATNVLLTVPLIQAQDFSSDRHDFVMALLAADEGNYNRALELINNVITRTPNDPVLLYQRASIYLDAGRIRDAESDLRSIVREHPSFFEAQKTLGRLLLDTAGNDRRRFEEAITILQAAQRLNPEDLGTSMAVAQLLASTNRLSEAEKILAGLAERVPDNRTINYQYAQLLVKLGRTEEAIEYFERVVASDPSFTPAAMFLAEYYAKKSEFLRAAEVMSGVVEEEPLNLDLQRQQGVYFLRGGASDRARAVFENVLALEPDDDRIRFFLAEALSDLDEHDKAEALYKRLLEAKPDDPELLISYAMSLISRRQFDQATAAINRLLQNSEIRPEVALFARTQLAVIDYQKQDYDGALRRSLELLAGEKQPNYQAVNISLDIYRRQKRYAEAVTTLERLITQFPSDVTLNGRLVEFHLRAGNKEKAKGAANRLVTMGKRGALTAAQAYLQADLQLESVEMLERIRKTDPEDIDVLFQLGAAYERAKKPAEAEKVFTEILEKQSGHAATLNYLGYMWADAGKNLERAKEMLLEAVRQQPRNGAYVDSLGWVYFRLGDLQNAERYLIEASELMPRDPTISEHLGDLFAKKGNVAKAREAYEKALKNEPEPQDEKKIRAKISSLEKKTK